jgi:tetratricopeptide (TPR) repeat protein
MEKKELLEEGDSMTASHQPDSSVLPAAQADFLRHKADSRRERGEAQCRAGDLVKGLTLFQLALDTYRSIDDHFNEAYTLQEIGDVHFQLEQLPQALTAYRSALDLYRPLADPLYQAVTLRCIGAVFSSLQQSESALDAYYSALDFFRADDNGLGEAGTLTAISCQLLRDGQFAAASAALEQAFGFYRAVPNFYSETLASLAFAETLLEVKRAEESLQHARHALQLSTEMNDPKLLSRANQLLEKIGSIKE